MIILILMVVLNISFANEALQSSKECQLPECISTCTFSDVDYSEAYKKYNKDNNQVQKVSVFVKGSFKDKAVETYELNLSAFIGGLNDCVTIPVLGFHESGQVVIKTNKGALYIKGDLFNICKDCFLFIDSKSGKILKRFNLVKSPESISQFSFSKDLKLYYLERGKCIEVDNNSLFKTRAMSFCEKMIEGQNLVLVEPVKGTSKVAPLLKRRAFFELFKSKELSYLIYGLTNAPADT